jgi:type II secretory pathway pseudopilin PulG
MKHPAKSRGFTLVETLAITAVIGALAATAVPVVDRTKESAKRSKCASNVRQIALHLITKANQHPTLSFPRNAGSWAWDVSHTVVSDLVSSRAGREVLYCPFSNMTTSYSIDMLYNFQPNSLAVTSYVLLIPGTRQVQDGWTASNPVSDYLSDRIQAQYNSGTHTIPAAQRPLVVDAVISNGINFTNITGALPGNVSNHMAGTRPAGGHAAFVDGSVRWRNFQLGNATQIVDPNYFTVKTTGSPTFWF